MTAMSPINCDKVWEHILRVVWPLLYVELFRVIDILGFAHMDPPLCFRPHVFDGIYVWSLRWLLHNISVWILMYSPSQVWTHLASSYFLWLIFYFLLFVIKHFTCGQSPDSQLLLKGIFTQQFQSHHVVIAALSIHRYFWNRFFCVSIFAYF